MTEVVTALSPDDVQLAHGVGGLLGEFNRAGVLGVADVHTARALGRVGREPREDVQLAAALAVRALRAGSVCIDLTTVADAVFADTAADDAGEQVDVSGLAWPEPQSWLAACADSPLVAAAGGTDDRPLRLADGLLYLERYWGQEETVRVQLQQRAAAAAPEVDLDRLRSGLTRIFDSAGLGAGEPDLQRRAAAVSVLRWVSVLAGGPGTGKTTTVAKLLALLHDQHAATDATRAELVEAPPSAEPADATRAEPADATRAEPADATRAEPADATRAELVEAPPSAEPADATRAEPADATRAEPVEAPSRPLRVALAAPTGKAAARLEEAVREASTLLPDEDRARLGDLTASTVHRLLGWVPGNRSRFAHHGRNHLPYDVVVVDEMSMVSLTLMARLLDAVRPDARLILVGDPDQLASVEAGAVLADIVGAPGGVEPHLQQSLHQVLPGEEFPPHGVVRLEHTWRYGGAIDTLARSIRAADPDRVLATLRSGDPALVFVEPGDTGADGEFVLDPGALQQLRGEVTDTGRQVVDAAEAGDVTAALAGMERHRLLCAHRRGPYGVTRWSREAVRWLTEAHSGYAAAGEWYPGRPLLITANDYEMSLYNGDTGVVVQTEQGLRAAFARGGTPALIAPVRLDSVQSVHAMTVHRAQGSQFRTVSFMVPPPDSPLLTRELLYTAVTRATERVLVFGTEEAIRRAVVRPANRASGLRDRLSGTDPAAG